MPYFDFHVHPSLKSQFSKPEDRPAPWDIITLGFVDPDLLLRFLQCQGINEVVDSQASLSQMIDGNMNLVAIALHPPEMAMMNDGLIQKIAADEQTPYINNAKVDAIGTGDIYFTLLNQELDHLEQHLENHGKKLKLLTTMNEYDAANTDTIHAILNIEGPHAFYGKRSGKTLPQIMVDFRENFRQFMEERGVKIFAMNIAHLQENDFCNHAFGIQVFNPEPFFPQSTGLSNEGLEVIEMMKQKNILLDIKHASLFARQQIYQLGWHGQNWPLVCTHAGFTGIPSVNRRLFMLHHRKFGKGFLRVKHYKPIGHIMGTSFNPCSINLYNDDAKEIIRSGGIIGLSMDQRILGAPDELMMPTDWPEEIYDQEIVSPGEREFFRGAPAGQLPDEAVLKAEDIETTRDRQNYPDFHARHFLNQVFHLFLIAPGLGISNDQIAKSICLGSDFDGMINPIDCCKNVSELDNFMKYLVDHFAQWEAPFAARHSIRISDFITPAKLLENIFYQNGVDFLRKWYV